MRELRFRVWNEDQKTYKYKFPYNSIGDFYVSTHGIVYSDFGNTIAPEVRQKAFIVEQYTGLKDKNGKEIYEGDILRWKNSKFSFEGNGVVVYEHGGWCVTKTICTLWACITLYKAEVIGNIHENPELLEGAE